MKYFGLFDGIESIEREFQTKTELKDEEVLVAWYDIQSYEGTAEILFARDGELYHVSAGHCSCYGLEDQWNPSPIKKKEASDLLIGAASRYLPEKFRVVAGKAVIDFFNDPFMFKIEIKQEDKYKQEKENLKNKLEDTVTCLELVKKNILNPQMCRDMINGCFYTIGHSEVKVRKNASN